jgi:hypothetical protein
LRCERPRSPRRPAKRPLTASTRRSDGSTQPCATSKAEAPSARRGCIADRRAGGSAPHRTVWWRRPACQAQRARRAFRPTSRRSRRARGALNGVATPRRVDSTNRPPTRRSSTGCGRAFIRSTRNSTRSRTSSTASSARRRTAPTSSMTSRRWSTPGATCGPRPPLRPTSRRCMATAWDASLNRRGPRNRGGREMGSRDVEGGAARSRCDRVRRSSRAARARRPRPGPPWRTRVRRRPHPPLAHTYYYRTGCDADRREHGPPLRPQPGLGPRSRHRPATSPVTSRHWRDGRTLCSAATSSNARP